MYKGNARGRVSNRTTRTSLGSSAAPAVPRSQRAARRACRRRRGARPAPTPTAARARCGATLASPGRRHRRRPSPPPTAGRRPAPRRRTKAGRARRRRRSSRPARPSRRTAACGPTRRCSTSRCRRSSTTPKGATALGEGAGWIRPAACRGRRAGRPRPTGCTTWCRPRTRAARVALVRSSFGPLFATPTWLGLKMAVAHTPHADCPPPQCATGGPHAAASHLKKKW
eukprot:scaffold24758_cov62-Phaeocystis_antarctica.AAC.3